jgi:hypothetical protein
VKSCKTCKRNLEEDEFAKPERVECKGCELFNVTRSNEKGRGKPLEMTREELLDAFGDAKLRRCYYCGISEPAYVSLEIPTPSGRPGLRLGLDRVDTSAPYTADNVVVCCLVCNRLKSSTFSHEEMIRLGRQVNQVWRARGLDAKFEHDGGEGPS